jgi:hypothetical protein
MIRNRLSGKPCRHATRINGAVAVAYEQKPYAITRAESVTTPSAGPFREAYAALERRCPAYVDHGRW